MTSASEIRGIPRPWPTAADRAEAVRLLPELFPPEKADPEWVEQHRPRLVAGLADAVMMKRTFEEDKAKFSNRKAAA